MPAGQVIGRVSVKVLPDTDSFRRDAERQLDRIEKKLEITIPTKINMAGASKGLLEGIRQINARNRASDHRKVTLYTKLEVNNRQIQSEISKVIRAYEDRIRTGKRFPKLRVDAVAGYMVAELDRQSLKDIEDKLRKWRDKMSPIKIQVKPELAVGSTTWVEKRMDYLTRPRSIPVIPYLSNSGVAKFMGQWGTFIATLSGGRVLKSLLGDIADFAKRLDKLAPKIGAVGLGILGLMGYALSAASNLFALSASLAQIGATAFTLPATFAAVAIGAGTLIAVFKDFNKVLPEVKGKLAQLQDQMSEKFWAKAQKPIRGFINELLPEFTAGFKRTSTAAGNFFATFANHLKGTLNPVLPGMFDGLIEGADLASKAAAPLANIITTLGSVGANYLPQIGWWIQDIAAKFDLWLSNAAVDGRLTTWIDNGLVALHELGQVAKNAGGILAGLSRAATAAGGSGLGMMADTLERVHAVVDSPAFQTGLTNVLKAAHDAMTAIGTTAGPALTTMFSTLSTTLTALLPTAGTAIGTLVTSLAQAFANPVLQKGLISLFDGINAAIQGLAPAFGPIATVIGVLGKTLGNFLATLGPTLGTVLTTVAQMGMELLPALNPLISLLGAGLSGAIRALAPMFVMLSEAVAGLVSGGLLDVFRAAIGSLLPVVAQLAPIIGQILVQALQAITPLLPMIASLFASIVPLIGQLIVALMPLVAALLPALAAILAPVITIVSSILQAILPPLIAAVTALVAVLVPVIQVIAQIVAVIVSALGPVLVFVASLLMSFVVSLIGGFTRIFSGIMGIFEGFKTMFSGGWGNFFKGLWQVAVGIWNVIVGAIQVALNIGILGAAKKALAGLKALWSLVWNGIKVAASSVWIGLKVAWSTFLSALRSAPSGALNAIRTLFSQTWNSIKTGATAAWSLVKSAFSTGVSNAVSTVKGLPGKALGALGNVGSLLSEAGRQLIQGFISGITSAIGGVKSTLQGLTSKLKDWKGPESLDKVLLVNAGQLVIDGFIKGLESRYDAVKDSLRGLTDDIGGMAVITPQIADVSGATSAVNAAIAGAASGPTGVTNEINVSMTGSDTSPEDVAEAILHAQRRFAYGSAYSQ